MLHHTQTRTAALEPEPVLIDVMDVDRSYIQGVRAYLDRDLDVFHLPRESARRLGRPADDGVDFLFVADWVVAKADVIQVAGKNTRVWTVPVSQLVTRPGGS